MNDTAVNEPVDLKSKTVGELVKLSLHSLDQGEAIDKRLRKELRTRGFRIRITTRGLSVKGIQAND